MQKINFFSTQVMQFLAVCFLSALFINRPEALLQNDLDSAVRWASAHFFHPGSPQHFLYPHTNGPLFFLKFPIPGDYSILLSVLFDVVTKILLGYYLIQLAQLFHANKVYLPLIIHLGFCVLLPLDFIIIGIVLSQSLWAMHNAPLRAMLPAIVVLVLAVFIKASISFPALFIFGSTVLVLLFHKKWKEALQLLLPFLFLLLLAVWLLYGNLFEGIRWVAQAFLATLSYGNDQAIFFNNFLPYILLTIVCILLVPILVPTHKSWLFMFISALAIFAVWNYSIGRMDFTHYRAWYFLCITLGGIFLLINKGKDALLGFACFFLSLTFFSSNTQRGDSPKEIAYNLPRIDLLPRVLFRYQNLNEEYKQQSMQGLHSAYLSDSMLAIIQDKPVDVFPWGVALFYKYAQLNYQARPAFHSTILGQQADSAEAKYFGSEQAPQFLLWHDSEPGAYQLNAHDQVYLPNAVPKAVGSLLTHYDLRLYEHGYALWGKSTAKKSVSQQDTSYTIKFNTWCDVPTTDSASISWAKLNIQLSSMDKLIAFLYKGPFFKIAYKLADGSEAWHFISLTSLQQQFLLQPYFTNPAMEYKTVKQIFIEPMSAKYHQKSYTLSMQQQVFD